MSEPTIKVERCVTGRLAGAYPAASHDVELQVAGVPTDRLAEVLRTESDRVLTEDPRCRKVVFGAPVDDLEVMAAAEAAGFRYVVDVDVPDDDAGALELALLVREPAWVTRVDMDLERVPQT